MFPMSMMCLVFKRERDTLESSLDINKGFKIIDVPRNHFFFKKIMRTCHFFWGSAIDVEGVLQSYHFISFFMPF